MKTDRLQEYMVLIMVLLHSFAGTAYGSDEIMHLTVERAVSMALEENLDLRLGESDIEITGGDMLRERGAFDPGLEVEVSRSEQDITPQMAGGAENEDGTEWRTALKKKMETGTEIGLFWDNGRTDTDSELVVLDRSYSSTLGVSISQPLLKGNSIKVQTAGVRAAEKARDAATYLVEDRAARLAADVKKAYWELVFARQDIEVKRLSLKLARNLRDEISRKIESGVLARIDIYQPESEIARREEFLIAAGRNIANAEDHLKFLMNSRDWSVSFIPDDTPETILQTPDLQAVLENALSRRQDIKAGDLRVAAAEIMFDKAKDDLKPSLSLDGSAGLQGVDETYGDAFNDMYSDSDFSWKVGLMFRVPIGNRSAHGGLARSRAELAKSRYRAGLLRQQVTQNAREAVRNVTVAMKTIEATRKTSLAHRKRLEAEQEKFKVGMSTPNDVLEFQDAYAQALINEKRALIDLARAQADLERVQGMVRF